MLDIVKQDAWLEPVAQAVRERYERYQRRYDGLVQQYGSLANFATAHKFSDSITIKCGMDGGIESLLLQHLIYL